MAKKDVKANKNVKENKNENSKNKKSYFKGFKAELKKVIWPTPKQLVNNTVAVITIVLLVALIVFVLDLTFESLNKYGVDKLKEVISTENTTAEDNTTTDNTTSENETTDNTSSENESADNTTEGTTEGTDTENGTADNTSEENTATEDTTNNAE